MNIPARLRLKAPPLRMIHHYFLFLNEGQEKIIRATAFPLIWRRGARGIRAIGHATITFSFKCIYREQAALQHCFGISSRISAPAAKIAKFVIG